MSETLNTPFTAIYESFYSKITDDMYMELTPEDTAALAQDLLLSAVHKFEFPRKPLDYQLDSWAIIDGDKQYLTGAFYAKLDPEEINILATYMIVEWLGQQLASIENVRMKYSGSDFKFTSQANHMQKVLQMKKDYEREGFHLQRLYKRRIKNPNGVYHTTMSQIMAPINSSVPKSHIPPVPPGPGPGPIPPTPPDPDKEQYEDGKIWDDLDDDQDWQTPTGRPWEDLDNGN